MRIGSLLILLLCGVAAAPAIGQTAAPVGTMRRSLAVPVQAKIDGRLVDLDCTAPVGPAVSVSALAFSPDGKTLAAAGYREVALWDLVGARLARRIGAGMFADSVRCLAFASGGKLLVVGEGTPGERGAVWMLDASTGALVARFDGPTDVVDGLALSPDEKLLAAASVDGSIYVWSVGDRKQVARLKGHKSWVYGVAFSPDGKLLASAGADMTARLWQTSDWQPGRQLDEIAPARGVAFSPDGTELAIAVGGPNECGIRVREVETGKLTRYSDMGLNVPQSLVWDAPSKSIVIASGDHVVRVLNASGRSASLLRTLAGHGGQVFSTAVSPDGLRLASGSEDGTVKLWNARDGKPVATLAQLAPGADDWLIVSPDGFAATSSERLVSWRSIDPKVKADALRAALLNPDAVRRALAPPAAPAPRVAANKAVSR